VLDQSGCALAVKRPHWQGMGWLLSLVCGCLLAACSFPGSLKPTVKIGLSAPFEGRHRDLGYEALYAVRLAVRERNAAGGIASRYLVEFVALNDLNEPEEAARQAREMAADPGVLGVLGGWSSETGLAAAPEYERLGLAFLTPEVDLIRLPVPDVLDQQFVEQYRQLSGGAPPGAVALWAYAAANRLLDALDEAARDGREPTRQSAWEILSL